MNALRQTQPVPDPLVDEARAIRRRIEEECQGDWEKLFERLRRAGEEYRRSVQGDQRGDGRVK